LGAPHVVEARPRRRHRIRHVVHASGRTLAAAGVEDRVAHRHAQSLRVLRGAQRALEHDPRSLLDVSGGIERDVLEEATVNGSGGRRRRVDEVELHDRLVATTGVDRAHQRVGGLVAALERDHRVVGELFHQSEDPWLRVFAGHFPFLKPPR
jgi:hypothetical protein